MSCVVNSVTKPTQALTKDYYNQRTAKQESSIHNGHTKARTNNNQLLSYI